MHIQRIVQRFPRASSRHLTLTKASQRRAPSCRGISAPRKVYMCSVKKLLAASILSMVVAWLSQRWQWQSCRKIRNRRARSSVPSQLGQPVRYRARQKQASLPTSKKKTSSSRKDGQDQAIALLLQRSDHGRLRCVASRYIGKRQKHARRHSGHGRPLPRRRFCTRATKHCLCRSIRM